MLFLALVVLAWLVIEIVFAAYFFLVLKPRLRPLSPADKPAHSMRKMIAKTCEMLDDMDPFPTWQVWLNNWFPGAAPGDMPMRSNMIQWLAWAFYSKEEGALTNEERAEVEAGLGDFERHFSHTFPEGHNPNMEHVHFTLDEKLGVLHRPLMIYVVLAFIELVGVLAMRIRGFSRHRTEQGLSYWYHEKADTLNQPPVIFFHGLGAGLMVYFPLVLTIMAKRSVIYVEQPWISMLLHFDVLSAEAFVAAIRDIVQDRCPKGRACIMGHSYGSVPVAWVCREMPEVVAELALLDPISVILVDPTVVRSVIYTAFTSLMSVLAYFAAFTEVGIAYTLRRNFHWYNQCMFADDLACADRCFVAIADQDIIVPAENLARYFEKTKAKAGNPQVLQLPGFAHGQLLFSPYALRQISSWLAELDEDISDEKLLAPQYNSARDKITVSSGLSSASGPLLA